MSSLPIAVQVYSVRDDAAADLYATLKKIKEMGYDGVEFAGLYGNTPATIKAWCEELGLVPVSAHVPFIDMLKDPMGVLSQYAEIGCKYVAVPYLVPEHRPEHANFPYVVEFIHILCKAAKKLGMTMLYHNHDFEFKKLESGEYGLDYLYANVPADLLQTELDQCWVKYSGLDPVEYLKKYTGRAPVVHLKDFHIEGKQEGDPYALIGLNENETKKSSAFEFRPLGNGVQDIPSIIAAAKEAGSKWLVVEQDQPDKGHEELQCAEISRAFLKKLGW